MAKGCKRDQIEMLVCVKLAKIINERIVCDGIEYKNLITEPATTR